MRKPLLLLIILAAQLSAIAQTKRVIMEGFIMGPHWDGAAWDSTHTGGAPCPADPLSFPVTKQWYYDRLAQKANEIATSGITAIWLPSVAKGSAGYYGLLKSKRKNGAIYDVGYGVFDDYDLGDKLQNGSIPTRYGTRTQLTRCVAVMHANGLDVYHDFVLNQRSGQNMQPVAPDYQVVQYKDAFGNKSGGRFPKYTTDFHNLYNGSPASPGGSVDSHTPSDVYPDGSPTGRTEHYWGPDLAHITGERNVHGDTGVYCATELDKWGDWLLKATGMQGYRLDDASGISWDYIKEFINYGAMKGKFAFAEQVGAGYSTYNLKTWMQESVGEPAGGRFTMFDQSLQPVLLIMCKTNRFNMSHIESKYLSYNSKDPQKSVNAINPSAGSADPGKGIWYRSVMAIDPTQAVTVLNEADMETPIGSLPRAALPKECLMAYAYLFTIGYGTPCISIKDWSTDAECYGTTMIDNHNLNYHLNKLIWCYNFIISGGLTNEQASSNGYVYAFEHTGGKHSMVFLNSDHNNAVIDTANTTIPNGTVLVDYTDHNIKTVVKNGKIIIKVPANKDGRGYLVMAKPGITGSFTPVVKSTTQEWDASADLSIRPASDKKQLVCRIWVDKNKTITSSLLDYNTTKWAANTSLTLEIDRSSADSTVNMPVASRSFNSKQKDQAIKYTTPNTKPGYYSFWMKGNNLPTEKENWWFNLQNKYTAPQK